MAFKLDPESEVNYRVRLAQRYLLDAEDAYKRGDYRGVVASSQLVAENAAKAVIAVYRVPSWTHDRSSADGGSLFFIFINSSSPPSASQRLLLGSPPCYGSGRR